MSSTSFSKRQKERERQERQREKAAKREERKKDKATRDTNAEPGVDPDIAGIVPGPQPPIE